MSHVRRFDHVGLTVADLDVVTAFFVALGLEVEGRTFVEGEFLDAVCGIPGSRTEIEDKLKTICDAALEGKRVDIHDNLFEVGASSLKLIEIHEQIDREYPGKVDLTELFDFPTIAELAQHLQSKLAA